MSFWIVVLIMFLSMLLVPVIKETYDEILEIICEIKRTFNMKSFGLWMLAGLFLGLTIIAFVLLAAS